MFELQQFICTDNGVSLTFLPEEKAEEYRAAKKRMEIFYSQSTNLIARLNIAQSKASSKELRNLAKITIIDIKANVDFYKTNKINPFDFTGATSQLKMYETRATAILKLVKNQKSTITCRKGSLLKKITGKNPKCPKGYKKA